MSTSATGGQYPVFLVFVAQRHSAAHTQLLRRVPALLPQRASGEGSGRNHRGTRLLALRKLHGRWRRADAWHAEPLIRAHLPPTHLRRVWARLASSALSLKV